ncbi:hypothetical protein ACFQZZ_25395 [Nocardia sp. GCM10030253]|uniref:hypothetical protein n=1 Tax=Nocardia sp. GCM10030253 TaxID=3273404 RepID=UPI003633757A
MTAPEKEESMHTDGESPDFQDEFLSEEEEALLDERDRIDTRPGEEGAPPGLSRFLIQVEGPVGEYADRLRTVLAAALDRSVVEGRVDSHVIPRPLPEWFVAVSSEQGPAPDFARHGSERYGAAGHGAGWSLDNWLWRFELDCPFRTWSWWDVTHSGPRILSLWVDAGGEDFFACDDLRWATYTSGALTVSGPDLHRLDTWLGEPSVGTA